MDRRSIQAVHEIDCGWGAAGVLDADVAQYETDGVVVLRGVIPDEGVQKLQAAVEAAKAAPVSRFRNVMGEGGGWVDKFLWRSDEQYRALAHDPALTSAVAQLMQSATLNLLYDHTCVKEPGDEKPTLWHHDVNYLPVEPPHHFASAWVALDAVGDAQGRLEFVRGSHRWKNEDGTSQRFQPMDFPTMSPVDDHAWEHPEDPTLQRRGFLPLPDIQASRESYDIVSCDMCAGDVIVFHGLTLHYSGGNRDSSQPRRAISLRYCGSDARYTPRRKEIASGWPLPLHLLLQPGDPLTCELFPLVHSNENCRTKLKRRRLVGQEVDRKPTF